jgi:hypothetical protein
MLINLNCSECSSLAINISELPVPTDTKCKLSPSVVADSVLCNVLSAGQELPHLLHSEARGCA